MVQLIHTIPVRKAARRSRGLATMSATLAGAIFLRSVRIAERSRPRSFDRAARTGAAIVKDELP